MRYPIYINKVYLRLKHLMACLLLLLMTSCGEVFELEFENPDVILPVAVGQVEMPLTPVRGKTKNKYDDVLKYLNKKEG